MKPQLRIKINSPYIISDTMGPLHKIPSPNNSETCLFKLS